MYSPFNQEKKKKSVYYDIFVVGKQIQLHHDFIRDRSFQNEQTINALPILSISRNLFIYIVSYTST